MEGSRYRSKFVQIITDSDCRGTLEAVHFNFSCPNAQTRWLTTRSKTAWLHILTSLTTENKDKEKGQAGSIAVCVGYMYQEGLVVIIRDQRCVTPADFWNWANGDLRNTNEGGPSLIGLLARRAGTGDFYPALAAPPVRPVQNIFFPIAQQPGQAVVQRRLSLPLVLLLLS